MSQQRLFLTCGFLVVCACDGTPSEERLQLTLFGSQGIVVDTVCDPRCGGQPVLDLEVEYADDFYPMQEVIELHQYRIDYALDGVRAKAPYFAGRLLASLAPGEAASVSLEGAGTKQRAFVFEEAGNRAVTGIATLTLAGYDWDDAQVFVKAEFPVRFADVGTGSEDAAMTDGEAGHGE